MTTPPSNGGTGDRDVISSLPRTRPERRSAKRDAPKARASGPKATPPPRAAAKPVAKAKAKAPAVAADAAARKQSSPPPAGWATPGSTEQGTSTSEIVTTALQAAGELAQIGLTLGRQFLKSATDRVPRP